MHTQNTNVDPRTRIVLVLNIAALAVMAWMIYEVLGIGNLFQYKDLSSDDAETQLEMDALQVLFDPVGFVMTTTILTLAIAIHLIARNLTRPQRSTVTKASMIISIVFYGLSFFRITAIVSFLFASIGSSAATTQTAPDTRIPSSEELLIEPPQLAEYIDSNGTRVISAFTNTGDDHWESALVLVSLQASDGSVCMDVELEADWIGPGERRELVSKFLEPAMYFSDPSCVPTNATVSETIIDVDSRSEKGIDDYESRSFSPKYASLAVYEEEWIIPGQVSVSVAGALTPESVEFLASNDSLRGGFEITDLDGNRLAWCFKQGDVGSDGSFRTNAYHSPVDPSRFTSVIAVPNC